jgi:ribosomal-protein-alanine N-acetyltransferase
MEIDAGICVLRPYSPSDRQRLAEIANDRRLWLNMLDLFPHPYTLDDADEWISRCEEVGDPPTHLAIEYEGIHVGGIGVNPLTDVHHQVGDVGYWLTPTHWGMGIATAALTAIAPYAFETFSLIRLQAGVFGWNPASGRVLEKCGFELEGHNRNAVNKDGKVTDLAFYGLLR